MYFNYLLVAGALSTLRYLPRAATSSISNTTWDYIVVGGGASGIPLADKLSESGKSVLLLERGFASSYRWGGKLRPKWLEGSNLTRFDVPALYQYIWANPTEAAGANVLCSDYVATASCVLGGGTAINAGLWWKPGSGDWDTIIPAGWKSAKMRAPTEEVFARLPGTERPSSDGGLYLQKGADILKKALTSADPPYELKKANDFPNSKDRTVSNAEHFFMHGERGGVMETFLVSASERENFKLQLDTTVNRVIRQGKKITGVQVATSGWSGTINVTPNTGEVILSTGVFGTSKILFRSGSPDGVNMVDEADWIDLPVGHNLDDNPSIYGIIIALDVDTYDYVGAFDTPVPEDAAEYLTNRSAPLAQIEPPLNPFWWDSVTGTDGIAREIQWSTISGQLNGTTGMVLTASLGRSKTSRGRLGLSLDPSTPLTVNVTQVPYFNDDSGADFTAVVSSFENALKIVGGIPNVIVVMLAEGQNVAEYLQENFPPNMALNSNHWVGSTKMGEQCRKGVVVDGETRVCGVEGLHIVDAGIVGGVPAANLQGVFVAVAVRAGERILKLDGGYGG
ncbi:FAD/NAD(P)-binding domain-containing protein [Mytilinidion resinicola]|uniref:FAD/NAD(P)-binding domain-containing protein n=1 Tax=Mytilinidion resinicola TaxID=574789 RepID=A0A6A6Y4Q5_9PEZI|nr:FAD/NAD(P)-binding domain-containing protein [Mytilinidion resinicola]KAF2803640.1 FAD/NAD(P)-binding domain-containing protein [Mytilinidion resinicola]